MKKSDERINQTYKQSPNKNQPKSWKSTETVPSCDTSPTKTKDTNVKQSLSHKKKIPKIAPQNRWMCPTTKQWGIVAVLMKHGNPWHDLTLEFQQQKMAGKTWLFSNPVSFGKTPFVSLCWWGKGSEDKKDTACCNCSTGRVCRCSPSMLHMLHTSQSIALTPKTHQHSDLWFDANQEVQMLSYHRRVGWIRKIGVCAKSGNFAKGIRSEKTDFILSVYKGCGSLTPFPRVSASTAPNPPSTPTTFTFSPYISFVCNSPVSNSQPPNSCGLGLLRPSASFCVGPAKSPSGFPLKKALESTLISEGGILCWGVGWL